MFVESHLSLCQKNDLFSPTVVIEFPMEIDEAIDVVLRMCGHQLIAVTHNGLVRPTRRLMFLEINSIPSCTDQPGVIHHLNY